MCSKLRIQLGLKPLQVGTGDLATETTATTGEGDISEGESLTTMDISMFVELS